MSCNPTGHRRTTSGFSEKPWQRRWPGNGRKLYKSNILDLYGELYYSGTEVRRILELDELPTTEEVVYLISTEFPQYPDRSWVNLLAPDYSYRGHRLFLWKGTLRPAADN